MVTFADRPALFTWLLTSAIVMIVGALAPWATVVGFEVPGTRVDGVPVLVAAGAAVAVLLFARVAGAGSLPLIVTALAGLIAVAIIGHDAFLAYRDELGIPQSILGFQIIRLSWGFVAAGLGSLSLAGASAVGLLIVSRAGDPRSRAPRSSRS